MKYFTLGVLTMGFAYGLGFAQELQKQSLLTLRPTQIAVGMIEVSERLGKLQSMKPSKLESYLKDHPLGTVLGPSGEIYIDHDHHHLARAEWELGIGKSWIEQNADMSHLSPSEFWKTMRQSNRVYLYDQYGNGPHDPALLPTDVRGLADDPYRSVSWKVRKMGGYDKVDVAFLEFKWADFFRKNLKIQSVNDHFDAAVNEALKLAISPEAAGLPGYRGPAR